MFTWLRSRIPSPDGIKTRRVLTCTWRNLHHHDRPHCDFVFSDIACPWSLFRMSKKNYVFQYGCGLHRI